MQQTKLNEKNFEFAILYNHEKRKTNIKIKVSLQK